QRSPRAFDQDDFVNLSWQHIYEGGRVPKHSIEYEIGESKYKADLALLDKYHAFSAEILRLALLILAAIGVLLRQDSLSRANGTAKECLLVAVIASGFAA